MTVVLVLLTRMDTISGDTKIGSSAEGLEHTKFCIQRYICLAQMVSSVYGSTLVKSTKTTDPSLQSTMVVAASYCTLRLHECVQLWGAQLTKGKLNFKQSMISLF